MRWSLMWEVPEIVLGPLLPPPPPSSLLSTSAEWLRWRDDKDVELGGLGGAWGGNLLLESPLLFNDDMVGCGCDSMAQIEGKRLVGIAMKQIFVDHSK